MRGRQMSAGKRRGLVGMVAKTDNFADGFLERGPIQLGGRVVSGIASEDDKSFDRICRDGLGEVRDGDRLIGGDFDEVDRAADVSERRIDRVGDRMNRCGLVRSGDDETGALVRGEIGSALGNPLRLDIESLGDARIDCVAGDFAGEGRRKRKDMAAGEAEAMVGHRAGERKRTLGHVESIHRVFFFRYATPLGEFAGVIKATRLGA